MVGPGRAGPGRTTVRDALFIIHSAIVAERDDKEFSNVFLQSSFHQIYFQSNQKPQACEDIYLPPETERRAHPQH